MRTVITETQSFSVVGMRASNSCFRCRLRTLLDAGFELCQTRASCFASWPLQCSWDASFDPRVWVLYWYWGAGFMLCVLALHEWLWLASRLGYRLCSLMTCLQWFLDSLQNPLQSFQNSVVDWDGFWNTLDFSLSSNALKTGLTIFWDILSLILSGFWSPWVYY